MPVTIENILLIGSLLLLISIVAGKTTYRFGVPTLLLFLGVGMLAGSDGLGGIAFNDPKMAQFIGVISLNFILFSGGLDTNIRTVKPILGRGIMLSTAGVLFTALSLGFFVWQVTDFSLYESLLLGSIVSSTDAAAVFSILRSKRLALKSSLRPTLELESGSNDPMAYVLTIAFLTLVTNPEEGWLNIVGLFLRQMIIGGISGWSLGKLSTLAINRIKLDFEGLYPVLVIALMFLTFSITNFIGGNGFLAIYICAVYLGNQELIHKKTILRMFDGLAWLMQIVLFLTLGLLVFPSQLIPVVGTGLLISLFLIFLARPIGVFLSLIPFRMRLRNRFYLAWVGLRGAVPIVFATYPLLAGIEKANMIFNLVFFIAVSSVLIQGTSLSKVAKWLHVTLPEKVKPIGAVENLLSNKPKALLREIIVPNDSKVVGRKIITLQFPADTVIALIRRNNIYITPDGNTKLEAGDLLSILSGKEENMEVMQTKINTTTLLPENRSTESPGSQP
jgi:potassium/hydrogen antiporter